ncbi:hypothetical protein R1flu_020067 [Riccia fluitans]|uniref:Uncharacterized protein n=1 Tax=Riccia fluitans TaxID=41844 RepID=A0ABD1ZNZ7_9MARC
MQATKLQPASLQLTKKPFYRLGFTGLALTNLAWSEKASGSRLSPYLPWIPFGRKLRNSQKGARHVGPEPVTLPWRRLTAPCSALSVRSIH